MNYFSSMLKSLICMYYCLLSSNFSESGEWANLSHRERAQNLSYLQHIGMIAR